VHVKSISTSQEQWIYREEETLD